MRTDTRRFHSNLPLPCSLMHYLVLIRASLVYLCGGAQYVVRHVLQKYLAVFTISHCLPYVRCRSSYSYPFVRPINTCYVAGRLSMPCSLSDKRSDMDALPPNPCGNPSLFPDHRCLHRPRSSYNSTTGRLQREWPLNSSASFCRAVNTVCSSYVYLTVNY